MTSRTATIVVTPGRLAEEDTKRIAKAFGCGGVNSYWVGDLSEIMPSTLLVTTNHGLLRANPFGNKTFAFPVRVVTYNVAMEEVKAAEEAGPWEDVM